MKNDQLLDIAKGERTAIFIDGASFYNTAKALGIQVDYKEMRSYFAEVYDLLRIQYFAFDVENEDYSPVKPVLDWLSYNGYIVHVKNAFLTEDSNGKTQLKGADIKLEIGVAMMELPTFIQHVVLFTGDADYVALVKAMQRRGCRVTIVSSVNTNPSIIADDLRKAADQFFNFEDLAVRFTRKQEDRDRSTARQRFEQRAQNYTAI
jgi:uncharacterized LabA/DUF88 family protein